MNKLMKQQAALNVRLENWCVEGELVEGGRKGEEGRKLGGEEERESNGGGGGGGGELG